MGELRRTVAVLSANSEVSFAYRTEERNSQTDALPLPFGTEMQSRLYVTANARRLAEQFHVTVAARKTPQIGSLNGSLNKGSQLFYLSILCSDRTL